jgi:hypothetical protein
MQYMLLLYIEDRPEPGSPEAGEYYGAVAAFTAECRRRGVFVAADPLERPASAVTVRVREGTVLNTDGPFAETTEWLAGYMLLECRSQEEALELASLCPVARHGTVEVRPVWDRGG